MMLDIIDNVNNKIEKLFLFLYSKYKGFTLLCFLFMIALLIFLSTFSQIFDENDYSYLLKAFEIKQGIWIPTPECFVGWPILISVFLQIFKIQSIFKAMVFYRVLNILIMSFSIFPFAYLAEKLINKKAAIIAVLAFAFSPVLISQCVSQAGGSDILFIGFISNVFFCKSHFQSYESGYWHYFS